MKKTLLVLTVVFFCKKVFFAQGFPIFQEEDGLVVIEAESALEYFSWVNETTIPSFSGDSYLHYQGSDYFNTPGISKMTYKISITSTGKYRFQWRSRIAQGSSNTDHNDSWLRFPDAAKFYAEKNGIQLYPVGSGMTPNPNGSSSEGWFKVYQNVLNNWTWKTTTSDHDPHNIFVEFDTAGIYTLEVSGRSTGHALDRLVLYHSSISEATATNTDNPESVILNPVSSSGLEILPLKIAPNPVAKTLFVELPGKFQKGLSKTLVLDTSGKIIYSNSKRLEVSNTLRIPVDDFPSGMYWLQIANKKQLLRSSFIKE